MFEVNVSQLMKESVGSVRHHNVDDSINIAGHDSHIHGRVVLTRIDRGILVQGKLLTDVILSCSRCLDNYTSPLPVALEDEYCPNTDVFSGARLELPDEPGLFSIDEHHIIDLSEAARQYAVLAIPMKPLCRKVCAGLCPDCGHNLNHGRCSCPPRGIDPRWMALTGPTATGNK